jgi:hypothetical protein
VGDAFVARCVFVTLRARKMRAVPGGERSSTSH